MQAVSQAGAGSVTISTTGTAVSSIMLDFIDVVGLDGIEEDMDVVVPGVRGGDALPK